MNTRKTVNLALTALACAVVAHAQTSTTSGAVRGTIKSKKGGVVAGASVLIRNLETGYSKTAVTDAQGGYLLSLLPVGNYELTVTAPGLASSKEKFLQVNIGQTVVRSFNLDSAKAEAVVEIVATTGAVDTAQINAQTSISQELVEAVPINGRNFTDLVQLTPGAAVAATDYYTSVEGARGVQNNLQIDGASFNSRFNTEQRGGTRVPFSFAQDSIKELQVITNTFDAQFGDAVGAVVNAVTKTGTNEFTGMAFTLFRPNSMVAKVRPVSFDPKGTVNNDDVRTRHYQTVQGGFNLGGPIIKDKLHFFINAEWMRKREDSVPAFGFNGSTGMAEADFNQFFGPTGMGSLMVTMPGRTLAQENFKSWTDEQTNLAVMARLDWTINADHRATLRLNSQNYKGENDIYSGSRRSDIAESGNSDMDIKSFSTVAELQSVLNANLLNEARVQYSVEKRPYTPNSTICSPVRIAKVASSYYINAGQYYIDPRYTNEYTTQLQDNLTFMTGDWTFKGGVDLQFIKMDNRYYPNANGSWVFPTYAAANEWFTGGAPSGVTYTQGYSPLNGISTLKEDYLAGYLQAQYAGLFNKRLLLSLGLRYTSERWNDNPNPNRKLQGLDRQPNDSALDPRFGFSFDIFGNAKTVIRGGYGWFSVSNPGQTASGAIMNNGLNLVSYYMTASNNPDWFKTGGVLSARSRWSGSLAQPGSLTAVPMAELLDGTFTQDTVTATIIDPDAKMTQARAASLAVEHDFGNGWTGAVRATYKQFRNLQYAVNINLGQYASATGGNPDPKSIYNDGYLYKTNRFSTATNDRPYKAIVRGRSLDLSGFGDVILSKYDGEGNYKSLVLEGGRQVKGGWGFKGSLTFSKAMDNNSNERATLTSSNALTENPADPLGSYAYSDNDRKFRATLAWYAPAIWGVRFSGITTYSTGVPWNAVYYADKNGDGKYIDTADGRNTHRQPGMKTFDLRVARTFHIVKHFSLEGIIDVYNVFNWANLRTSQYQIDDSKGLPNAGFGLLDRPDNKTREVQLTLKARF